MGFSYDVQREPGQTDYEYFDARNRHAFEVINHQRIKTSEAREHIPDEIYAPEEHFLVASGNDGYPVAYKIQARVRGQPLINAEDIENVKQEHAEELKTLLRASRNSYLRNGHCLDLIGTTGGDEGSGLISFKERLRKFLRPLDNSKNIFISEDDRIALVDIETMHGKSSIEQFTKFLCFEMAYWNLVLQSSNHWKGLRKGLRERFAR